ncbi:MAG: SCO family protein [Gammaproteobacteria bacterium]|nr:MAG: SCO family protein [Gammaproteobacteria bacterium]
MTDEKILNTGSVRLTVIVVLAFIVLVVSGFAYKLSQPRILNQYELKANGAVLLDMPRKFSDFKLTDQKGELFTQENLKGKWTLIFFGFTHCPDVCPTTLAAAAKMYAGLKPHEQEQLQILLVSLDPERDTPEQLAKYVPYFNPDFLGASGDKYMLLKLATELNVAFNKVELENGDYTIDHSGNMVLINPYGHYHGFFRPPFEEGSMRLTWRSIAASF